MLLDEDAEAGVLPRGVLWECSKLDKDELEEGGVCD